MVFLNNLTAINILSLRNYHIMHNQINIDHIFWQFYKYLFYYLYKEQTFYFCLKIKSTALSLYIHTKDRYNKSYDVFKIFILGVYSPLCLHWKSATLNFLWKHYPIHCGRAQMSKNKMLLTCVFILDNFNKLGNNLRHLLKPRKYIWKKQHIFFLINITFVTFIAEYDYS